MMEVYAATVGADPITRSAASSTPCRNPGNSTIRSSSTSKATTAPAPKARCKGRPTKSPPSSRPSRSSILVSMMDELGSDRTYNHYPIGWAHAMDTPFQWTKQVASHFGGTRNGLAISWPKRIKAGGEIRSQFHHVIDIVPTILEAAGIQAPLLLNGIPQKPMEGVSMVYTFDDAKAPTRHTTQYFEMTANRAIYHDGWMASTTPLRGCPGRPWAWSPIPTTIPWELYNLAEDFSQSKNLAKENPKKLARSAVPLSDGGGQVQRAAHRFQLCRSHGPGDASQPPPRQDGLHLLPGHDSAFRKRTLPTCITSRSASPPRWRSRKGEPTACSRLRADGSAAGALLVLDGKPMFAYAYTNQDGDKYPKQRKDKTRIVGGRQARAGQAHHRLRLRLRRRRYRQGRQGNAHGRWQEGGRGSHREDHSDRQVHAR